MESSAGEMKRTPPAVAWAGYAVTAGLLYAVSRWDYLLFHTLIETLSPRTTAGVPCLL